MTCAHTKPRRAVRAFRARRLYIWFSPELMFDSGSSMQISPERLHVDPDSANQYNMWLHRHEGLAVIMWQWSCVAHVCFFICHISGSVGSCHARLKMAPCNNNNTNMTPLPGPQPAFRNTEVNWVNGPNHPPHPQKESSYYYLDFNCIFFCFIEGEQFF